MMNIKKVPQPIVPVDEYSQLRRLYEQRSQGKEQLSAGDAMAILRDYYAHIANQLPREILGSEPLSSITYGELRRYVQAREHSVFGVFIANSLLMLKDGKIQIERNEDKGLPTYEIPAEIQEYLSEIHKKEAGAAGLINQKMDVPAAGYYTYNQHVANIVGKYDSSEKYIDYDRKFARAVFDFDFKQAYDVLANSPLALTKDAGAIMNILHTMKSINEEVYEDKNLRKLFLERSTFQINGDFLYKKTSLNADKEAQSNAAKSSAGKFKMLKTKFEFVVEMCNSIWLELENPYFKAVCLFLGNKENRTDKPYDEILLMTDISVRDRFTFAKRFLSAGRYEQFRVRMRQEALSSHRLESIMVFGKEHESETVLQNYMDYTQDMETVAILSVYFRMLRFSSTQTPAAKGTKYQHFIEVYKAMIGRMAKDKVRIQFDKKIEQIEKEFKGKSESSNMTYLLKCNKCGSGLAHKILLKNIEAKKRSYSKDTTQRLTRCFECTDILPPCCLCLMPISIKNPYYMYDPRSRNTDHDEGVDEQTALVWCQKCKHGGHLNHVMEWFAEESRCPVGQCDCLCVEKNFDGKM